MTSLLVRDGDIGSRVEAFLFHEARLLDRRQFDRWLDLYTETATYWVPSRPDQQDPFRNASLIYDDRRLLETRVRRLAHPKLHAQVPSSRTSRLISNVEIEKWAEDDHVCVVQSVFQLTEFRNEQMRFFAGSYTHELEPYADGFRIRSKRVDLVNSDSPFSAISVPF